MRVKFTKDYDYTPTGERRVTIAYKAGMDLTVKREAGEAAVAAGAAREIGVAKSVNGTAAQIESNNATSNGAG